MARGGLFAIESHGSVHALVVDDDPAPRDVRVSLMRYCSALVTPVTTVEETLITMDQVKPDVVVFTVAGGPTSLPRRNLLVTG